jgi:hypothetical protein
MTTKTAKTTMLGAAAIAAVLFAGAAAPANAGKKHLFFKHHHFYYVPTYTYGPDCSFYKYKWLKTGNPFWKAKYFSCIY